MPLKEVSVRRGPLLLVFLILLGSYITMGVLLKNQIDQVRHDKASIVQLERGGCKIKVFLDSSTNFRERAAKVDKSRAKKRADLQAARVSHRLALGFSNELCPK